jgi:hypothetical protein
VLGVNICEHPPPPKHCVLKGKYYLKEEYPLNHTKQLYE